MEDNEQAQKTPSQNLVGLMIQEIYMYRTDVVSLSDMSTHSMFHTIQDTITHQNGEFLTPLSSDEIQDGVTRDFYDIITPMVETTVVNIDFDSSDIEAYTDDPDKVAHSMLANCLLKQYLRQTNQGEAINENLYHFVDDGNVVVRYIDEKNRTDTGDVYRRILPQNIIVTDATAESPEKTTMIEKNIMVQSEVRKMKNWANKEQVYELCNVGSNLFLPYYEIYYRYGEMTREMFGQVMEEVHGIPYKKQDGDEGDYIQTLAIMARAKRGQKNLLGQETEGFIVFIEELKPKTINITKKLKITRYKPYEMVRLGQYSGRFWGKGYREIGKVFQDKANVLANQCAELRELASKMVFWSKDKQIAGKNILSSIKNGQILQADDLQLLNNVFPNLSFFSTEWNNNLQQCREALKSFEIATGEVLPSTTSATAINVQNTNVGKYFNFKREKFGLFYSRIFKRWVVPELLNSIDPEEALEIVGDPSFFEQIAEAYVNGWMMKNYLKTIGLAMTKNEAIGVPSQEDFETLKEIKKQELLKHPKLYIKMTQDFFKDVEFYIGINITGEAFNKQAKISNALALLNYELNPALANNPDAMDTLNWVKQLLGLKVNFNNSSKTQQQPVQPAQPTQPSPTANPQANLPTTEPSVGASPAMQQ